MTQEHRSNTTATTAAGGDDAGAARGVLERLAARWLPGLGARRRATLVQFVRFCLVGASGMLVDLGTTFAVNELVLVRLLGRGWPELAAVAGFCLAVSSNYALNRLWTFRRPQGAGGAARSLGFSFGSFVAISLVGMGISIGVMHLCLRYLALGQGAWYLLARFVGIVVATLWNFAGSKLIAFRGA